MIVLFFRFFLSALAVAGENICADVFSENFSEAQRIESSLKAIDQTFSKNKTVGRQYIYDWYMALFQGQENGQPINVMEHTVLTFLLRKDFFNSETDIKKSMAKSLKKSWKHFLGKDVEESQLLGRLPNKILRTSTRDEVLFHQAIFHEGELGFLGSMKALTKDYIFKPQDALFAALLGSAMFSKLGVESLAAVMEGYALSTFIEYLGHRYLAHASKKSIDSVSSMPWLKKQVQEIYFSHSLVHHGSYGNNYVEKFAPQDISKSDAELKRREKKTRIEALIDQQADEVAKRIRESDYGTRLSMPFFDAVLSLPLSLTVALLTKYAANLIGVDLDPAYYFILLGASTLYVPASHYLHPYLHMNREGILNNAGRLLTWFLKTRYVSWVAQNHFSHHANGGKNDQNLVLGSDFVFGYQPITIEDLLELKKSGAIY